jgi:hypothetical protein
VGRPRAVSRRHERDLQSKRQVCKVERFTLGVTPQR